MLAIEKLDVCRNRDLAAHDPIGVDIKASRMPTSRRVRKQTGAAEATREQIEKQQACEDNKDRNGAGNKQDETEKFHKTMGK